MHNFKAAFTLVVTLSLNLQASAAARILPNGKNFTSPTQYQEFNASQSEPFSGLHKPQITNIPIPLEQTGLSLTITYLGETISPDEVDEHLYYGIESVRHFLPYHSQDPIRHGRWSFGDLPDFQVLLSANPDNSVTYTQLFSILERLEGFMLAGEKEMSRNLQFDVHLEGKGKIGFGLVWHEPPASNATIGAKNATSFHHSADSSSLSTILGNSSSHLLTATERHRVDIPAAGLTLIFDYLGAPIPLQAFSDAFAAVNLQIIDYITRYMAWPIPNNRYEYDDTDAHIVVIADRGIPITWLQLFQILQGLYGFVTGTPPRCQVLHYQIYSDEGVVGFGLLWYDDSPRAEVGRASS